MSLTQRVKQGFLRLPKLEKALLAGSFVLMVSPLLPWYDNRNAFGVGEAYLGVQGPLFLIGILVGALGGVCFLQMFLPLLGKNFFKARRNGGIALAAGLEALVLVLISNSIFFHPAFGSNVTHKATRFGVVTAFVGIGVLLIAGYFTYRKNKSQVDEPAVAEELQFDPVPAPVTPYSSSYENSYEDYETPAPEPVRADEVGIPPNPNSPYSRPAGAYQGDPLQLDPKTRYKMLSSQARQNLWQNQDNGPSSSASSLSSLNRAEREVTDNMKIRTDL